MHPAAWVLWALGSALIHFLAMWLAFPSDELSYMLVLAVLAGAWTGVAASYATWKGNPFGGLHGWKHVSFTIVLSLLGDLVALFTVGPFSFPYLILALVLYMAIKSR